MTTPNQTAVRSQDRSQHDGDPNIRSGKADATTPPNNKHSGNRGLVIRAVRIGEEPGLRSGTFYKYKLVSSNERD